MPADADVTHSSRVCNAGAHAQGLKLLPQEHFYLTVYLILDLTVFGGSDRSNVLLQN